MPGQIALDTRYYPNDFQVNTFYFQFAASAGSNPGVIPLMTADRDIVVDSAILYLQAHPTTGSKGVKIKSVEPAAGSSTYVNTLPSYGTSTTDVTSAHALSTTSGDYPKTIELSVQTANNHLRKGSRLFLHFSGDSGSAFAALTPGTLTIRFRSQV